LVEERLETGTFAGVEIDEGAEREVDMSACWATASSMPWSTQESRPPAWPVRH